MWILVCLKRYLNTWCVPGAFYITTLVRCAADPYLYSTKRQSSNNPCASPAIQEATVAHLQQPGSCYTTAVKTPPASRTATLLSPVPHDGGGATLTLHDVVVHTGLCTKRWIGKGWHSARARQERQISCCAVATCCCRCCCAWRCSAAAALATAAQDGDGYPMTCCVTPAAVQEGGGFTCCLSRCLTRCWAGWCRPRR